MGLAGPRKRVKLSHDPNNTTWTKDENSFGQRILRSHGWQPGSTLGAKDASHAEFFTAASSSHVRVSIKDDTLGLGAKKGSGVDHGENVGLDAFKNILSRLNGKEEAEIKKEQDGRDNLRRQFYAERKFGSIRFVSGGFLVGNKVQQLIDGMKTDEQKTSTESNDDEDDDEEEEKSKSKKSKKSKKRKESEEESESASDLKRKEKREKKEKKEKKKRKAAELATAEDEDNEDETDEKKSKESKKERKERKEREKKEKKEKKKAKKSRKESSEDSDSDSSSSERKTKKSKRLKSGSSTESSISTKESTPLSSVSESSKSGQQVFGRHAVRSKWIAQKRMAVMDTASLNQIFMIKS